MKQVAKKKKSVEQVRREIARGLRKRIAKMKKELVRLMELSDRHYAIHLKIADEYCALYDEIAALRARARSFQNSTSPASPSLESPPRGKQITAATKSKTGGKVVGFPQRTKPVRYDDVTARVFLDKAAKE